MVLHSWKLFVFDESDNYQNHAAWAGNSSIISPSDGHVTDNYSRVVREYNLTAINLSYFSGAAPSLHLQNGDFISGSNLYRRTFRTKMETNHNSVPQPVIHRIAQRAGTNILELDFEVIDTDDDNVTVGILAYCGSDKLVPQSWLNGTGSKIGTPIATNTVHSMEWDVKQDWPR